MKGRIVIIGAIACLVLSACGGGGSTASTGATGGGTAGGGGVGGGTTTFALPGTVTKGPMNQSSISVIDFSSIPVTGPKTLPVQNKTVGSGVSKNGKVTLSINTTSKKKILVAVSDAGSYVDEATGKTVAFKAGQGFHAIILPGQTSFTISPLSEMAYQIAIAAWKAGMPAKAAVTKGRGFVLRMFGVHPNSTPDNPLHMAGAKIEAMQYAGVLAGFSQLLQNPTLKALRTTAVTDFDFYQALIADMKDGTLDGKTGAAAVKITGSQSFMPALGGTTFRNAISTFLAAHPNFNPKARKIPFRAPSAISQPTNAKYGYLTVNGVPPSGSLICQTWNTSGCSNGVFIPLTEMVPASATYTATVPADPKQFQIVFKVPGLFTLTLNSTSIIGNYMQIATALISRYDVANGQSIWTTTSGKTLLARGMSVNIAARTVTFNNARMYYTTDVYAPMDSIVLNGTLKF